MQPQHRRRHGRSPAHLEGASHQREKRVAIHVLSLSAAVSLRIFYDLVAGHVACGVFNVYVSRSVGWFAGVRFCVSRYRDVSGVGHYHVHFTSCERTI